MEERFGWKIIGPSVCAGGYRSHGHQQEEEDTSTRRRQNERGGLLSGSWTLT